MGKDGRFILDTCTFNMLINVHYNARNIDETLNVFKKMLEFEV